MQGGSETPRHLARAAPGGCPGAPTSSREAHPGRGLPGARARVPSEPPRGPQKFALVSGDLPLGRGGRCGRLGRAPPPARVSGTAAGGPPGGRWAPQPRSDGRGGGGHGGSGSSAGKERRLAALGPRPTQRQPDGGGGAPEGGGPRPPGYPLREAAPSRGKAGGESPGGERGAGWGERCCSFARPVSFLKGFGDRAGFPAAQEPLKAAQQGLGCKSYLVAAVTSGGLESLGEGCVSVHL